jgi:hypothetical protein
MLKPVGAFLQLLFPQSAKNAAQFKALTQTENISFAC